MATNSLFPGFAQGLCVIGGGMDLLRNNETGGSGNLFSADCVDELSDSARGSGYLSLLFEIARVLSSTPDVKASLDGVLELLAQRLHMMQGTITLVSPKSGQIRIEASYGLKPSERSRGHYHPGEGIIGHVVQSGEPMYISRVSEEPRFLNRTRSRDLEKSDISYICVPIRLNRQVVGALSVDRLLTDEERLEEEEQLLFKPCFWAIPPGKHSARWTRTMPCQAGPRALSAIRTSCAMSTPRSCR